MSDADIVRLQSYAAAGNAAAPADASTDALDDDALVAAYSVADRRVPTVRMNFVTSLDGSATVDGVSGGLGGPADKAVFDTVRRLADVVLVGAGTVRSEGYGAMRLSDADAAWRQAHGLAAQPAFALVSGRLDLDPASDVFVKAPVRPLVLTSDAAPGSRRAALEAVATVISCGTDSVDARQLVCALVDRGLTQILCEGGPSLFGTLIDADLVDELCLTVSPLLEGGAGIRISHGATSAARRMRLVHVLESNGLLLTRYARAR
ncbi:pyrimidine reductase family protein [Agreia sp. COWG]|uniref:pyrimidine reductase family protein n=1 Tax=Agreia sp. COWG TaxID=2773266 RepID=UPI0019265553|nr:pyrimidine reductase family protein [Agreia sp. COWG]CAD5994039.1 Pyrimidine reductase, riboflavin biosynthesis [Agreia sp. COWG]